MQPVDADRVLADLAAYWADPEPSRFTWEVPGRIAGGPHDQLVPAGTSNPYWEIIRQLPLNDLQPPWKNQPEPVTHLFTGGGARAGVRYFPGRHALCASYSWSIPSPGDIAWMKGILGGRGVAEIGAGGGYWAWQLQQAGIDIVAYDPREVADNSEYTCREWTTVLRDDHSAAARHPDRALFLCWPTMGDPWAARALDRYPGDLLIYAAMRGCCAGEEFYQLLDSGWEDIGDSPWHVSFEGINCWLTAYRRL
jgi:hypothetical protein